MHFEFSSISSSHLSVPHVADECQEAGGTTYTRGRTRAPRDEETEAEAVKEEEKAADSENSVEGYEFNTESTLTIVSTAENERDISTQL